MTAVLLLFGAAAHGSILEVCDGCTYTSLDGALTAAVDGDELAVAAGAWTVSAPIATSIRVVGAGPRQTLLVPADGAETVLELSEGVTVELVDLAVDGQHRARGIDASAAELTATRVLVRHGSAGDGGGLRAHDSTVCLRDCEFRHNAAEDGKGGHVYAAGTELAVQGGRFESGYARQGAGFAIEGPADEILFEEIRASNHYGSAGTGLWIQGGEHGNISSIRV